MLFLDFSVDEYKDRLARIHGLMEAGNFEGLVLTEPTNLTYCTGYRSYLTNSRSRPFFSVIQYGEEPILVLPNLEVGSGRKTSWVSDVRGWGQGQYAEAPDSLTLVKQVVEDASLQNSRLGIEMDNGQRVGLTIGQWQGLQEGLPGVAWADCAALMWTARMIKSETEIEYLRGAARAADAGFMAAYGAGRAGATERELVRAMGMAMLGTGADNIASMIVSSGSERYDMINPYATDRKLQRGEQVIFDFGCWYRGYRSDITRWFYVAEVSEDQRRFNEAALSIFFDTMEAVKPGNTAADVDDAAFQSIKRRGYERYMLHRTGHALGLDVHERPSLAPADDTVLQPGMVLAVEPGIYDFSIGAWRMEDNVLVTRDDAESLNNAPREILVTAS
jgi:Xaa-Pro aminopeptidase